MKFRMWAEKGGKKNLREKIQQFFSCKIHTLIYLVFCDICAASIKADPV